MSNNVFSLDALFGEGELFQLGGRTFRARALSLAEGLSVDAAGGELEKQLEALAPIMARRAEDGKAVTAKFLSENLNNTSGGMLLDMLRTGQLPAEADSPNG